MPELSYSPLRVALFADTFYEANGVATLGRYLTEFAKGRKYPFLLVRGSRRTAITSDGSLRTLELRRGPASFRLDKSLYCDPLLFRHKQFVIEQLRDFQPHLIHVTGPGDLGFLGVSVAHTLKIPLVASWHTNLHEYLSRRLQRLLRLLPHRWRERATEAVERQSLRGLLRFYRLAGFVLAPNQNLVDLLHDRTHKPAFLMLHGVDLSAYSPASQARNTKRPFCVGYVGRLTTEKNIRSLVELERQLIAAGEHNVRFLLVGEGGQQQWLSRHMQKADLPGVLRGKDLTAAYIRMDAFVFPSQTDTFGLVILEAMACGVPVILAPETGRRIGIEDGVSGLLSRDFAASLRLLMHDDPLRLRMGQEARKYASGHNWNGVFEQLYATYEEGLAIPRKVKRLASESGAVRQ